MKTYDRKLKAIEAIEFLKAHPAFCFETVNPVCTGLYFSIHEVCKNGYNKYARNGVTLYRTDKRWEDFKHLLKKEEEGDECASVEVPYEDLFGMPWKGFRVKYWWELTFYVWGGPLIKESNSLEKYNPVHWQGCSGPSGEASSFEEMVIKAAKAVKKVYGDFCLDDFLTPEEKQNHAEYECFNFDEEVFTLSRNPKYIYVEDTVLNIRWLNWFMTTEYAKKNWDFEFKRWEGIIKQNS